MADEMTVHSSCLKGIISRVINRLIRKKLVKSGECMVEFYDDISFESVISEDQAKNSVWYKVDIPLRINISKDAIETIVFRDDD